MDSLVDVIKSLVGLHEKKRSELESEIAALTEQNKKLSDCLAEQRQALEDIREFVEQEGERLQGAVKGKHRTKK